jgi:ABC-2 type transport system ATP-binding protein
MIRLSRVTKKFGSKTAVSDLTLAVSRGEIFTFLGPNAAGKTTTIKMLTGLLQPTSGEIGIAGYSLRTDMEKVKKIMSYIPDFPYLYEKLTPRETFSFFADIYQLERTKYEENTRRLFELFEIDEYKDLLIENLSHGIKQRVVISVSLMHEPEVLIIDEPTVGLDPKTTKLLKTVLKESSMKGMTIFLSTHQLHVAQELADRIGIINEGSLIACGTYAELEAAAGKKSGLEDLFLELTENK